MSNAKQTKEEQLVRSLQNGDQQAISALYDDYGAALYGIAFRLMRDQELASDVLQEGFVKIWKNAKRYDSSKGTLFTWMSRIIKNHALDQLKSKNMRYEIRDQKDIVDTVERSGEATQNEDTIGVREKLKDLEPSLEKVMELSYFGGYTQKEIADELHIPLGTVKTRARKALNELRKIFGT